MNGHIESNGMFPLIDLPVVAIREVFHFLTITQRVFLATTSNKMMRYIINYSRKPTAKCSVHIGDERSHIHFVNENFRVFCGRSWFSGSLSLRKKTLKSWIKENETVMQNTVAVLRKISEIVSLKSFRLVLHSRDIKSISIREVLSVSELSQWASVVITGIHIGKENLDAVMEKADEERKIEVMGAMPSDYNHENAFNFYEMIYTYASWVRIEHLLALKNKGAVVLERHNLTLCDFNTLIKHWVQSDYDMFSSLVVEQTIADQLDTVRTILKDCAYIETHRDGKSHYLVCADSNKTDRRNKLLILGRWNKGISFFTSSPDKPIKNKEKMVTSFMEEFTILHTSSEIELMKKTVSSIASLISNDIKQSEKDSLVEKNKEMKRTILERKNELNEKIRVGYGLWTLHQT